MGSFRVAFPRRPEDSLASLVWASGTPGAQGKPGKPNFAISFPYSAGWRRGKGPPAVAPSPTPCPFAIQLHSLGSTQIAAPCSPASRRPGEGILRGSFPLQPASDIPTPTRGCLSAVAECHCSLFLLIRVDTAPEASPTPKLPRSPEGTRPGRRTKFGAHGGGRGGAFKKTAPQSQTWRTHSPPQNGPGIPILSDTGIPALPRGR